MLTKDGSFGRYLRDNYHILNWHHPSWAEPPMVLRWAAPMYAEKDEIARSGDENVIDRVVGDLAMEAQRVLAGRT